MLQRRAQRQIRLSTTIVPTGDAEGAHTWDTLHPAGLGSNTRRFPATAGSRFIRPVMTEHTAMRHCRSVTGPPDYSLGCYGVWRAQLRHNDRTASLHGPCANTAVPILRGSGCGVHGQCEAKHRPTVVAIAMAHHNGCAQTTGEWKYGIMRNMVALAANCDDRLRALRGWLEKQSGVTTTAAMEPVSSDASQRRYFRLTLSGGHSAIAMDAPPESENCRAYADVAGLLDAAGLHVPAIYATDFNRGFMLISDLGRASYADHINAANADVLFGAAMDALIRLQSATQVHRLPAFDEPFIARELDLFPTWFLQRHCNAALTGHARRDWLRCRGVLIDSALAQPQVFMHRDYMLRNLIVAEPSPGVIDFQDAVIGPVTYDVVSLFKDAFLSWPDKHVQRWQRQYWDAAQTAKIPVQNDYAEFRRALDWMGVQRHLKILGLFARLHYRDGKKHYLAETTRFVNYIVAIAKRYSELTPLLGLLNHRDASS